MNRENALLTRAAVIDSAMKTRTIDNLCHCTMTLSSKTAGRSGVSWREQQASLIFAKLCITCISFLKLIPKSSFFTATKGLNIWDLSSAASLARNIIESYCVLYYVGIDKPSDSEIEFRELLWEYP